MEGKRYKLLIFLLPAMLSHQVAADNRTDVYSAYTGNRMGVWKSVIDRMEAQSNKSNEFRLELINYQYGYVGYCIGNERKDEAQEYLNLAEKNVSVLEDASYKMPLMHAYRSAFSGYRISLNRLSVMVNGQRGLNHGKKSVELDPRNYFGWIQLGNAYFYMPKSFGGSKQTAFEYFDKARKIMETDPSLTKNNWNYLSLLVTIAQSHTYLEQYEKAKAEYEYILKIEPGFLYVKNTLYPELLSKMKSSR